MRWSFLWWLAPALVCAQGWPQWGQNSRHSGAVRVAGQSADRILAQVETDPFVRQAQEDSGGDLLTHYPAPLMEGADVFIEYKTGAYIACDPPGSGIPFPCGSDAWNSQIWNVKRLTWEDGSLSEKWMVV